MELPTIEELKKDEEFNNEMEENEMDENEESVDEMSKYWYPEPRNNGQIDLYFPEYYEFADDKNCYPRSFYTLNQKERLLLTFAENFRKQFINKYPQKRNLVLAVKNECNVQKFVCTSVRPTKFLIPELIGDLEGCANFVADSIIYEPLENHIELVSIYFIFF